MWTPANITEETFPLTYNLIYAGIEYEKYDNIVSKTAFADFARVEVLYQYGGFYFDFKFEALRPLDPFRKYEVLFNDCDNTHNYQRIKYFGASAGAEPKNYHLNYLLSLLFTPDTYDLANHQFNANTGSWNYPYAFSEE